MLITRISIILISMLYSVNLFAQTKVDVIAVEYPPFLTLSKKNYGTSIELLNKNKLTSNFSWVPLFYPPARANKLVYSGRWCASFYPPPPSENIIRYTLSEENVRIGLARLHQPVEFAWQSISELKSHSISLLRSSDKSDFINRLKSENISINYVESIVEAIDMVLSGKVDYAMIDNIAFNELAEKNRLQFSSSYFFETQINIYFNKQCEQLKPLIESIPLKD